jgi:uncharacterized protein (DUF983 family)
VKLERLTSTRRAHGPLFCPRCCWKLGRAESPAIAYLRTCGGCRRELSIAETADGGIAITVLEDPRDGHAIFVELES